MNKPMCKLKRSGVEHLIIRAFDVIKNNYSLEIARDFYNTTSYIRFDDNLTSYKIFDAVSDFAKKYVEIVYE